MVVVPSLLLILGSILLALWRPGDRRAGWAVQLLATGPALLAAIWLGPSDASIVRLPPWLSDLPASSPLELALSPWRWGLLVSGLGYVVARSVLSLRDGGNPGARAALLAFASATSLTILSAGRLSLVLTWSLTIAAQAWLVRQTAGRPADAIGVQAVGGGDLAALLLLIAAAGVSVVVSPAAGPLAALLLGAAAAVRLVAAAARDGPDLWRADLTMLTAASVFAALCWGWSTSSAAVLSPSLWLVTGAVLLLGGWFFGFVIGDAGRRLRAWASGFAGLALLATSAAPSSVEPAVAVSGMMLLGAASLSTIIRLRPPASRIASGTAFLLVVGVPGLVGALVMGIAASAIPDSAAAWITVAGIGLLASLTLRDVFRTSEDEGAEFGAAGGVAAVVSTLTASLLYFRLRSFTPEPSVPALLIAVTVAGAAALLTGLVPASGRARLARAFRWPSSARVAQGTAEASRPIADFVRGVRDVLEGDASLLWAMVVVVVGLLLLRVIP